MSNFHIRLYKDSDYKVARDLFAGGTDEHSGKTFRHALSLPHVWLLLLAVFVVSLKVSGSFIFSMVVVLSGVAALWLLVRYIYISYISEGLATDFLDIRKYYLEQDNHCFWVAESDGEVAGIVCTAPLSPPISGNYLELRRLSVPVKHRGKGIAKALCRVVIDFARKQGCDGVFLYTSIFQMPAVRLYLNIGFKMTDITYAPVPFKKFFDFRRFNFQYKISRDK
ncbi:probable N-acetyltransferase CML1 [Hyperolius riggenbachi]|uniref:probable N-acetyltransferase CML1 n=1 Tax=Hyperolius riggenbachi TaxID=752182 RepID=UPI0035A3907C